MKAVKIKKNGGPEVLDIEEITLKKPLNIFAINSRLKCSRNQ